MAKDGMDYVITAQGVTLGKMINALRELHALQEVLGRQIVERGVSAGDPSLAGVTQMIDRYQRLVDTYANAITAMDAVIR